MVRSSLLKRHQGQTQAPLFCHSRRKYATIQHPLPTPGGNSQDCVKKRAGGEMKKSQYLIFAIFVGIQSFLLQLVDQLIGTHLVSGGHSGFVFIAFQGWAVYFLLGSSVKGAAGMLDIFKGVCQMHEGEESIYVPVPSRDPGSAGRHQRIHRVRIFSAYGQPNLPGELK